MNRRIITVLIFSVFLLSGYITAGCMRHHFYGKKIMEPIQSWTNEEKKEASRKLLHDSIDELSHTYRGTPEGALVVSDPVFENEIYSLEVIREEYAVEYQTEVLFSLLEEFDDQRWNLWHAYKWFTISKQVQWTFYRGSALVIVFTDFPEEWGYTLAELISLWEASGGKREGDWMSAYKQSPEYEAWLDGVFQELSGPKERTPPPEPLSAEDQEKFLDMIDKKINELLSQGKSKDDPEVQSLLLAKKILQMDSDTEGEGKLIFEAYEPMSIEERYHAVHRMMELPICGRVFCTDFMRAYQRMVEISYERYLVHAAERDIVRAGVDAWVVEIAGDFHVRIGEPDFDVIQFLKSLGFPFKDFIIDICLIVGLSALFAFIIVKKILSKRL